MNRKSNILILSTHPDDEILSFGGLIIKEVEKGNNVHVHYFCVGGPCSNTSSIERAEEISMVSEYLGFTYSESTGCWDGCLDQKPSCNLTKEIDDLVNEHLPDQLYCTPTSEHSDHQALYKAFLGSCRLKSGFMPKLVATGVYQFSDQLYSSFDGGKIFNPLTLEVAKKKYEAFKLYKSQLKPSPSPLGIEGLITLDKYNGMLCGHQYAELYYQLRYIKNL